MKRTYHFGKLGSLWWREGLPLFLGGRELTPNGPVWWYPWNWVLLVLMLATYPVRTAIRKFKSK